MCVRVGVFIVLRDGLELLVAKSAVKGTQSAGDLRLESRAPCYNLLTDFPLLLRLFMLPFGI